VKDHPETIRIDEQEYVRADKVRPDVSGNVNIVVLQRGWVAIGYLDTSDDHEFVLRNAAIIRIWGTKQGLPELVNGPTATTVLDKAPEIKFHPMTAILTIPCVEAKWKKYL
jgi:hypothetical protein